MTARVLMVWDDGLAQRELETDDLSKVLRQVDELDGHERTLVTVYRGDAHAAVGGSAATGARPIRHDGRHNLPSVEV